jgi:hypothetical protein
LHVGKAGVKLQVAEVGSDDEESGCEAEKIEKG